MRSTSLSNAEQLYSGSLTDACYNASREKTLNNTNCCWLNNKTNKWEKSSLIENKELCNQANSNCSNNGACYKWSNTDCSDLASPTPGNVGCCQWLSNITGKWENWPLINDKATCHMANNKCENGGACYRWDTNNCSQNIIPNPQPISNQYGCCQWLNNSTLRWQYSPNFDNEISCINAGSGCIHGGACYRWLSDCHTPISGPVVSPFPFSPNNSNGPTYNSDNSPNYSNNLSNNSNSQFNTNNPSYSSNNLLSNSNNPPFNTNPIVPSTQNLLPNKKNIPSESFFVYKLTPFTEVNNFV